MSTENEREGYDLYVDASPNVRGWFEAQWRIWPRRVDERHTTNLSFHYGAIRAYRKEHRQEPVVSSDLRSNINYLDEAYEE